MLIKLLRYEFKALLRIIPALYLALLALAVVAGINSFIGHGQSFDSGAGLFYALWGMLFLALFIVNLMTVILRFRDNLLKDEGYLMFTLPVPEWALVTSKMAAALCTFLLSGVTCVISLIIFALIADYRQILDLLPRIFGNLVDGWAYIALPSLILRIVIALFFTVQQLCLVYTAMTVSHIAPRFRGLAGFGSYLAVMTFVQQPLTQAVNALPLSGAPHLLVLACFEAAFAVLYFLAANWLLKHRLNLE
ncbi:MAG: hypothetical protein LBB98_09255 [Treponema sp.]|jgi:hypothetical protein|nr:hypothetical protein [Treponema sp.]